MNSDLIAGLLPGRSTLTGWAFIEKHMALQIEHKKTTERHWQRHLEEAGFMASWKRYSDWKIEHPDDPIPPEINTVVSERYVRERAEWEAWVRGTPPPCPELRKDLE